MGAHVVHNVINNKFRIIPKGANVFFLAKIKKLPNSQYPLFPGIVLGKILKNIIIENIPKATHPPICTKYQN
jgi:hypothetical protein